jgi:hypothetical protein
VDRVDGGKAAQHFSGNDKVLKPLASNNEAVLPSVNVLRCMQTVLRLHSLLFVNEAVL